VFNHETRRTGARGLAAAASCQLLIDLALGTFSAYHCMRRNIGKTWDKVRCMGREAPYLLSLEGEGRTMINVRTPYVARKTRMHD